MNQIEQVALRWCAVSKHYISTGAGHDASTIVLRGPPRAGAVFLAASPRELQRLCRIVDEIEVVAGDSFGGHGAIETLIIEQGLALIEDEALTLLEPGAAVWSRATAITNTRVVVIGRRELRLVLENVPLLARHAPGRFGRHNNALRDDHAFR